LEQRRVRIDRRSLPGTAPSITRQCKLLSISRSGFYYHAKGISDEEHELMKMIDRQYLLTPLYGARKMAVELTRQTGLPINRKRARRLMQLMGIRALYRRPRTSKPSSGHHIYPYLLRDLKITQPNQVWAADITYIPMAKGFMYLVAIIDWYSRYVISWRLSNTMDDDFCVAALEEALSKGTPEIFNTDQGSQFTGEAFTGLLKEHDIKISMDGKGSYNDNLFIERLWRTVKYEEVYLKAYKDGGEARINLCEYFRFYNTIRPHQSLGYRTPAEVHGHIMENAVTKVVKSRVANTVGMAGLSLSKAPFLSY
jgi:putative transposase